MSPSRRSLLQWFTFAPLVACSGPGPSTPAKSAEDAISRIKPIFHKKGPIRPGDWLADHKEPGQTYQQFRAITPVPTNKTIAFTPKITNGRVHNL